LRKLQGKLNKESFFRILTSVIAIVALVAASFAWYTTNKATDSNSMQSRTEQSANIVIARSVDEIKNMSAAKPTMSVPLNIEHSTSPVRHNPSISVGGEANVNSNSYLQYVMNAEDIDRFKGTSTVALTYADAPFTAASSSNAYYTSAQMYIAALPIAMENQKLSVTMSGSILSIIGDANKAFSVDIYTCEVTNGKAGKWYYRGKLNYADTSASVVVHTGNIPLNTTNSYICVLANCFFDGELTGPDGNAYIRSAAPNYNSINAALNFSTAPN